MSNFTSRTLCFLFLFHFLPLLVSSQLLTNKETYTRYDSLLGSITRYRNYDVTHYTINLDVDLERKTIFGTSEMEFITPDRMDTIQVDLFSRYKIVDLKLEGVVCKYYRDSNHVFVLTQGIIRESKDYRLMIKYSGSPIQAKKAPWDGGFIWKKDSFGDHHVGVACEGLGASSWWPCKDHWSDEPDRGVNITITVPYGYKAISNGRLMSQTNTNAKSIWSWQVNNPINLYDVTLNIAKYEKIEEVYISKIDKKWLNMTYWVLRENLQKAKTHFKQVAPMMDCYESKFGHYPFYEDGYQLVETSYLGMEHQSCVAYGNKYMKGYLGSTNYTAGLDFDYIIIHETGHEWFGNNITAADNADMWIHEAMTTYAESIYAECIYGKDTEMGYITKMKSRVSNKQPIQGDYGVAKEGAGDMYAKGALFFHTLRYQINDDKLWYEILKDMHVFFGKRTTDYKEFVQYFNKKTKMKLDPLFSAYIQYAEIPSVKLVESVDKTNKLISMILMHPTNISMKIFYTINGGKEEQIMLNKGIKSELKLPLDAKFRLVTEKGYYEVK
jgi:aminopeptidase N